MYVALLASLLTLSICSEFAIFNDGLILIPILKLIAAESWYLGVVQLARKA